MTESTTARVGKAAGKVALVTGAANGIGEAVADLLAEHGAKVAAADLDGDALAKVVTRLTEAGAEANAYPLDIRDSRAVERAVDRVERELGPVDVLVNVAGSMRLGNLVELTDDDWHSVFAVNTDGVFYMSRAVARRMVRREAGVIVTVASNAARVPRRSMAAYAASKSAAVYFTKALGLELADKGIRCNVVSPGSTDTRMLRDTWTGEASSAATLDGSLAAYRVGIPLRKLATTADIAAAVLFLVSDDAGHITMHDLCVDGGAALGV
ncbi:2,3-dihydro-2,3-dihydroxybenzoate dehydrogenase [Saccharothrix luteola]|uniref:2,3-dihydro-2,3-dihydroxybenzoate dehydrogenase n=1 Tax=Saccharothrix luteola TaxID=2893018 RepID=UPI001E30ACC2|nr:2,3-dihydro-2,3-dihydroxybenzoate dehydrogenase [Saccharothrix luteola]MCC8244956.1 2,3-dihydro-2,3-dihydroxybenzoate dehydrogenase [Saccharothrix luteola]